jgi:hypothetical protein
VSSSSAAVRRESWDPTDELPAPAATARASDVRYFFFHVPKTGGRTIETHLIERFGEANVFHPKRRKGWLTDVFRQAKFMHGPTAEEAARRHVSGQFAPLSLIETCEAEFHKACFWRHPADWFVSFYNYRHYRNADKLKRPFAFGDFRKSMLRNPMTAHLLLYCGGMPGWMYFLMSGRQRFAAACALLERFDTFADIAEVDGFLHSVGYSDGRLPQDHNRIPPRQKLLRGLDEQARAAIADENLIDTFLHRLALGEDRQAVRAQADAALRATFHVADIGRLLAMPYYRFKVWVVPFLPAGKVAEAAAPEEGGFHWVPVHESKR